jgi:hypothetical protein
MPSIMPGMPGTKEAYGISIIGKNLCVAIPPKAISHYEFLNNSLVILTTTHRGESGFAVLNKKRAEQSIFKNKIDMLNQEDKVYWFDKKAYSLTRIKNGKIKLNTETMAAFYLATGYRLMSVKSTTIALSLTPAEIWKEKFVKRGLIETANNIDGLPVF